MANSKWNGSTGSYLDPAQWDPATVPLYDPGTIATIDAGTVTLSNAEPNNITLDLGGPFAASQRGPILVLDNAALGPEMTLDMLSSYATLDVEGYDTNFGTIAVGNPQPTTYVTVATIESRGLGQLNQDGTITVGYNASLNIAPRDFAGSTLLNNDGLIELVGGTALTTGRISGHGTVELASIRSEMAMEAGVDAGQIFALHQGTLSIDEFSTFGGTLSGFSSSAARVILGRVRCDAATYVHDGFGERLVLTNNGQFIGTLPLADTPDTQYTVTPFGNASTIIRPSEVYTDGSIPASITADTVTIRNAEPNGQTVALGGPGFGLDGGPNLILDNAALGPDLLVTVASPEATGEQSGTITVQGFDTNYGEIDVILSAGAQASTFNNSLTINIQAGSQLNQEGTIRVLSPGGLSLTVNGPGVLNNDGQIFMGIGSSTSVFAPITGSGTLTVDGGSLYLSDVSSTQTIDLLGGKVTTSGFNFNPTIKDWNSAGQVILSSSSVDSVQFNQSSDSGGDLQLFGQLSGETRQVGDLHLLGTYATTDFTVTSGRAGSSIVLSGNASPPV